MTISRPFVFWLLILLLIGIGLFRITSTYSVFWQTWDEPIHIAAGMEWLDKGQYPFEQWHPPLALVMGALGPYMAGIKGIATPKNWDEAWDVGNTILQAQGKYERNLTLSRIGILPFFIIGALIVAFWAKNYGGTLTAILATLLFTTLPSILAHSGFVTLDMACAALVAAGLFAFVSWLNKPTLLRSLLLGMSTGLAILGKISASGYLLVGYGLIGSLFCVGYFRENPVCSEQLATFRRWMRALAVVVMMSAVTIWAGYRFSFGPLITPDHGPFKRIDRIVGTEGVLHDKVYMILEKTPIPAPEFVGGLVLFINRNNAGHVAYLQGEIREQGWWYYFPLTFLVKTPIAFTLLSAIGFLFIFKNVTHINREGIKLLAPPLAVLGIVIIGMLGHVNNGLRQFLSVYPLLAIIAGYGAYKLLTLNNRFRLFGIVFVAILVSWQLVASFAAHPDYLTYFNEVTKDNPEKYGVDSDLDWGQDLKRLASELKNRKIKELNISYNGSKGIKLEQFDLPPLHELIPYQKATGWIAISIKNLKIGTEVAPYDQFAWLNNYKPVEHIGNSILLYHLP